MKNNGEIQTSYRDDDLLTLTQAAKFIGMSESFLKTVKYGNKIAFYKVGGNLKFKVSDLRRFIENCRVETPQEGQVDDA